MRAAPWRSSAVLVGTFLTGCGEETPRAGPVADVRAVAAGANVLLISMDTTRADRLGCYGHEGARTPTLDRIAAEGIRVQRALAPAPVTLPSHTTLMTGLNPVQHGVQDNGLFQAGPNLETLAELLAKRGYRTAAFVSAYVLGAHYGLDQGFEHYDDRLQSRGAHGFAHVERRAALTVNAALEWLAQAPPEPWFLWLHFFDPHAPYAPPEPFQTEMADAYDAELAYLDKQIDRFLRRYDADGRLDRTLLVVTSDHGEGLQDHNELTHGIFLYDTTLHVPLLLRFPALGQGKVLRGQVGLVDVLPTVMDLLGAEIPEGLAGKSFAPALSSQAPEVWHDVLLETRYPWFNFGLAPLTGLSTREYKLIEAPRPELYAWSDEEGEGRNLLPGAEARHERLRERLRELYGPEPSRVDAEAQLSEEQRRNLAELGYLFGAIDEESRGGDPKDFIQIVNAESQVQGFFQAGQFEQAETLLRWVLEEVPRNALAMGMLGHALLQQKKFDEAAAWCRRCLALRPDLTQACWDLAMIELAREQPKEALAAFDALVEHAPAYIEAYMEAARVAWEEDQKERSIAYLVAALEKAAPTPAARKDLERRLELLRGEGR